MFDMFTSGSALSTLNTLKSNTLQLSNALAGDFTNRATLIANQARSKIFEDAFGDAQAELEAKKNAKEEKPVPPEFQEVIFKNNQKVKSRFQAKIDKLKEQMGMIDQMAVSTYDKQEAKAKLRLEMVELKLQSYRQTATYDTPKIRARALRAIADDVRLAVQQFSESLKNPANNSVTEMPADKEAVSVNAVKSFDENSFEQTSKKVLSNVASLIRQETISAARIEDDSRDNTIVTLSKGRSAVTKAEGILRDMSTFLNTRTKIEFVDITV